MTSSREVIAYGRSAEILTYGNNQVVKLFRSDISKETAEEEYRIGAYVQQAGVAAPQPIAMLELDGRIGIVYPRIDGPTMLTRMTKQPWTGRKEAARMGLLHAQMHRCDSDVLPKQKVLLVDRINAAPLLTEEEKHRIIRLLDDLREDTKVCHGDYHPDNIIVGDHPTVIDWMTAMSGNPAGDVARTVLMLQFGELSEETPKLIIYLASRMRRRLLRLYLRAYMANTTLTQEEIELWKLPVAAARLVEGIPGREKHVIAAWIRDRLNESMEKDDNYAG